MNRVLTNGLLLLLLLGACTPKSAAPVLSTERGAVLNILLVDQSKSYTATDFDLEELSQLLFADACEQDTWLAVIGIRDESSHQQPLWFKGPLRLDTSSTEEVSIYQVKAVTAQNEKRKLSTQHIIAQWLTEINGQFFLTDKLAWSDVNGALELAATLAQQRKFAQTTIRLIILSDLKHELPDGSTLDAFDLPPNTTIYPIGLSYTADLGQLFPAVNVEPMASFKAAFFLE